MSGRWLIPEIGKFTEDELRRFSNGCLALATVPGNMDKARALCAGKPASMMKADIEFALSILDREVVPTLEQRKREFFRG